MLEVIWVRKTDRWEYQHSVSVLGSYPSVNFGIEVVHVGVVILLSSGNLNEYVKGQIVGVSLEGSCHVFSTSPPGGFFSFISLSAFLW